jgi:hypothetical protein
MTSISVRSRGPQRWTVGLPAHRQAERVRRDFRRRGLTCGNIVKKSSDYVFVVSVPSDSGPDGVEIDRQARSEFPTHAPTG